MDKEKKTNLYKIIFTAVGPLLYSLTFLPPDISTSQAIIALASFFVIMYFTFKTLKFFKII